jgi:Resolvase, N terminal domain
MDHLPAIRREVTQRIDLIVMLAVGKGGDKETVQSGHFIREAHHGFAGQKACEAYIKSQSHEGWRLVRDRYDDGGFSGGSMVRPALQNLLIDVQARRIDVIVVYKVDRSPWRPQRALKHRRRELERRASPDRAQRW